MTMPKFEPVAFVQSDPDGHLHLAEITKTEACQNLDQWDRQVGWKAVPLHTADQLTEAYEAGKREQASELAAEQAKNVELRRAFIGLMQVVPREVDCENMHHKRKDQHEYDETCPVVSRYAEAIEQADKVLAAPPDTSALETIVKKAGEVMREQSMTMTANTRSTITAYEAIRARGEVK